MLALRTRPFAILTALLDPPQKLGTGPAGDRKIVPVRGGRIEGPGLTGRVLPGGGDWARTRPDGVLLLDVRLTIETGTGALVYMTYDGMRHGPPETMARLAAGDHVDPAEMYFRILPRFETADPSLDRLNRIYCVGVGERLPEGPRYHIHEVL